MLQRTYSKSMFTKRVGIAVLAAWALLGLFGMASALAKKPQPPPPPPPPADPAIAFTLSGQGLAVCNADGTNATLLVAMDATAMSISWSPDGHSLAFVRSDHDEIWRLDVSVVNNVPTGSNLTLLVGGTGAAPGGLDWSPAGDVIVYGNVYGLFAVPAGGGATTQIVAHAGILRYPQFSPSADRIAYVRVVTSANWEIDILDLATQTTSVAYSTNGAGDLSSMDWGNVSDTIAFTDGYSHPWLLDVATSAVTPLGFQPVFTVSFSPDDSELVYESNGRRTQYLTTYNIASGTSTPTSLTDTFRPASRHNP